ncbi:MAG: spore cortex biosynthesis protein YabQ [Clostridia bacterium]|nr:spore cortex biosynthesis protein YabQ [Clostridia bacterium]
MQQDVSTQFLNLVYALATGAGISALFDIFRIIRIAVKHNSFFVFIEDMIYCVIALFNVILFFSVYNSGTIRFYLLFGIFCGFIIWHYTAGALIILQAKLILFILRVFFRLIFTPVRWILSPICKLFKKMYIFLKKLFIFYYKRVIILKRYFINKERGVIRTSGKSSSTKQKKDKFRHKHSFDYISRIPFIFVHRNVYTDKRKESNDK